MRIQVKIANSLKQIKGKISKEIAEGIRQFDLGNESSNLMLFLENNP